MLPVSDHGLLIWYINPCTHTASNLQWLLWYSYPSSLPTRAPSVVDPVHLLSYRDGSLPPHYQRRLVFNLTVWAACHGEALIAETDRYKSKFHTLTDSDLLTLELSEIAAI